MSQAVAPIALIAPLNTVIRAPKAKANELALVIPAPLNEGIAVCIVGPGGSSLIYLDKNSAVKPILQQELLATQYCSSDPNASLIHLIYRADLKEELRELEKDLHFSFAELGVGHMKGIKVTSEYTTCIFRGRIHALDPPTMAQVGLRCSSSEILPLKYYRDSKESGQFIEMISRLNTFLSGKYTHAVVLHDGYTWQNYHSQLDPKVAALLDSIPFESSSESAYKILMNYFLKEKHRKRPTLENIATIRLVSNELLPFYRDLSLSFRRRAFVETCRPLTHARAQASPSSAVMTAWENLLQDLSHPETLELLCLLKNLKQAYQEAGNPEALPILIQAEQALRKQAYPEVREHLTTIDKAEQSLPSHLSRQNLQSLLKSALEALEILSPTQAAESASLAF